MLLSSLTRKRCAILTKGYVEMPSNMGGVITIPFNDHVKEAVPKLVQRLQEAGFNLDAKAIGIAQAYSARACTASQASSIVTTSLISQRRLVTPAAIAGDMRKV